MNERDFEELTKTFRRKLAATPTKFHRYLYNQIQWDDSLIGLKGPKGCGKTTMLLQHIKETFKGANLDKVLYVSLDNLWFSNHDLQNVIEYHYLHGGTHLFIDEIHYVKKWQTMLKNFSDDYPNFHIVYTGSSMLQIDAAEGDLSRRQAMYEMRGLSFREYLEYEEIIKIPAIPLDNLLADHSSFAMDICEQIKPLDHFQNYLKHGYYPFYKNIHSSINQRLQSVVCRIIENDYAIIDDVSPSTIRKTKKLLMVLAERVPQLPKMTALYKELDTDRNQGLKMLHALERGGLLILLGGNTKSPNNLSRPDKIYINNPTLMNAISPFADAGTIRETFFINQLSQSHDVRYPNMGDFLVDRKHIFEVGGKGKTFDQIKDLPNSYLAVDDTEIGHNARIPLWMFGLLY